MSSSIRSDSINRGVIFVVEVAVVEVETKIAACCLHYLKTASEIFYTTGLYGLK